MVAVIRWSLLLTPLLLLSLVACGSPDPVEIREVGGASLRQRVPDTVDGWGYQRLADETRIDAAVRSADADARRSLATAMFGVQYEVRFESSTDRPDEPQLRVRVAQAVLDASLLNTEPVTRDIFRDPATEQSWLVSRLRAPLRPNLGGQFGPTTQLIAPSPSYRCLARVQLDNPQAIRVAAWRAVLAVLEFYYQSDDRFERDRTYRGTLFVVHERPSFEVPGDADQDAIDRFRTGVKLAPPRSGELEVEFEVVVADGRPRQENPQWVEIEELLSPILD